MSAKGQRQSTYDPNLVEVKAKVSWFGTRLCATYLMCINTNIMFWGQGVLSVSYLRQCGKTQSN